MHAAASCATRPRASLAVASSQALCRLIPSTAVHVPSAAAAATPQRGGLPSVAEEGEAAVSQ